LQLGQNMLSNLLLTRFKLILLIMFNFLKFEVVKLSIFPGNGSLWMQVGV
jgi:hypothetical protein